MAELYGNPGGLPLDSLHYWRKRKQLRRQRRAIRSASKPQQDACLGTSQSSSPSESPRATTAILGDYPYRRSRPGINPDNGTPRSHLLLAQSRARSRNDFWLGAVADTSPNLLLRMDSHPSICLAGPGTRSTEVSDAFLAPTRP